MATAERPRSAATGRNAPQVPVRDRAELRRWLEQHAATSSGVWLVVPKGPDRTIDYAEIVEELLCFGWIDGQGRSFDEQRSLQYVAPRKPTSAWSRPNKERVERLLAAGLMRPAGQAVIDAAVASGRWTALDEVEQGIEPADLTAGLDAVPAARAAWDGFPRSARHALLEWLSTAKTAPTRERRIAAIVSEAAGGRRANQWRPADRV
ncbi:YdeI/OmpD-associated family protein [Amnibacterium setariae]|uniref:Bacteriocin-protection protein, YdeI/OmpD-associated family n=1 Tax=Amnibacterium setariae TaxID=2306585 RepID=A0A3A1TVH0_9MICO|nr:YdeI/OmpD-associated family protein [Amnibacterium setariae]RIX28253.1 hypothetical protein D1781_12390 [Amnibacterium setariae]